MAGRYAFSYTDDSTYGRAVRLVGAHAAPGGVVVDLGCGHGATAEPLLDAGYGYVGLDADPEALAALAARGLETAAVDLADAGALAATLDRACRDRPVAAVTLLDCLEHLADPGRTLDALAAWCAGRGDPLVVVSLPNVAHVDLGLKLLSGHWDLTDVGLLDATHLAWFTERRVEAEFADRGWSELGREDVVIPRSEQDAPAGHPFWGPYSVVEAALRWLRACADGYGETYQFVRAFRRTEVPVGATASAPTLSAVVRVAEGTDAEELLMCLAAQDTDDVEVVVASTPAGVRTVTATVDAFPAHLADRTRVVAAAGDTAGDLANAGIAAATGTLVAVLEPGQVVTAEWARRFIEGAAEHPGRVVRVLGYRRATYPGPDGSPMALSRTTPTAPGGYDPALQFRRNQLPLGTVAVPRSLCRPGAVWHPSRPGPEADWAWATMAAMAAGLVDRPERTVITSWSAAEGAHPPVEPPGALAEGLMAPPVLMHTGAAGALIHLLVNGTGDDPAASTAVGAFAGQVRDLQAQSADLHAEVERLRAELAASEAARDGAVRMVDAIRQSDSWRVTAPLRQGVEVAKRVRRVSGRRR